MIKVINKKNTFLTLFLLLIIPSHSYSADLNNTNVSKKIVIENKIIDFRYENGQSSILNLDKKVIESLDAGSDFEKYYLIRSGVKFPSYKPNRTMIYFLQENDTVKAETCKAENLPNLPFVIGDNSKTSKENVKFFRSCIKYQIEDPKKNPIEMDEKTCNFTKIDDSTFLLSPGDCFIKAKQDQFLSFQIIPNKDCLDREYLVKNGFSPKELVGTLETWIYPANSIGPVFKPTRKLWEKSLSINLNPGNELLKTTQIETDDGSSYNRVSQFTLPDLILSSFNLSNLGNKAGILDVSFLISTFGGVASCNSSLCSNYLNYDVPLAPEVILYETPSPTKKYELGVFNRIGDRFPGQWVGEFKTHTIIPGVLFEKGKYSVDFVFSDPFEDYSALKKLYQSSIGGIDTGFFDSSRAGVDVLKPIGGLNVPSSTGGTLGGLPTFGNNTRDITGGLHIEFGDLDIIPRVVQSLNDTTFPPQYLTYCSKDSKVCNRPNKKENLRISIGFEITDVQGNNVQIADTVSMEIISDLYPKIKTNLDLKNKPTINCSSD